jgi:hypothetical protein
MHARGVVDASERALTVTPGAVLRITRELQRKRLIRIVALWLEVEEYVERGRPGRSGHQKLRELRGAASMNVIAPDSTVY